VTEGQSVVLTLVIHNNGMESVTIGDSALETSSFNIIVTNAAGKAIPRTVVGDRVLTPPMSVFANWPIAISPGQSRRYNFNLAQMFDLSRAGNYSVSVSRAMIGGPRTAAHELLQIMPSKPIGGPPSTQLTLTLKPLRFSMIESADSISSPTAVTSSQDHQNFLYMASQYSSGVIRYRVDEDESFSWVLDKAYAYASAPGTGKFSCAIAATADGRYVYVANSGDNTISQFCTGDDGDLSSLSPATVPTPPAPWFMLMDPHGHFLYCLGDGGSMNYAIGSDGRLIPMPKQSTTSDPLRDMVGSMSGAIDPTGKFMYLCNGTTLGFQLAPDGTPTRFATSALGAEHTSQWRNNAIAITPSGKFAYIGVSTKNGTTGFNLVVPMRIEANGTLTQLHGEQTPEMPPLPPGYNPSLCKSLAIDPSGQHMIVVNDGCLDSFKIGNDGSLTSLGLTPFKGDIDSVFFVPGGHIVYAISRNPISLMAFRFDHPYGGLTQVDVDMADNVPFAACVTSGIARVAEHWGAPIGGIAMSARLPDDVYAVGRPLVMTVVLKNTTSHPIKLGTSGTDMASFCLKLSGPGMSMPLLAAGHDLLDSPKKEGAALMLPAGGQRQYRLILSRLANFSAAGYYTVQVSRTLPGKATVTAPLQQIQLEGPVDGIVRNDQESIFSVE
jgi:6-phosphogluconolactonase (cycloisomerase 2 family)